MMTIVFSLAGLVGGEGRPVPSVLIVLKYQVIISMACADGTDSTDFPAHAREKYSFLSLFYSIIFFLIYKDNNNKGTSGATTRNYYRTVL